MSDIADLSAERWRKNPEPAAHTPRDALVRALAALDDGRIKADHLIVVFAHEADGRAKTGWLQAGSFNSYAQVGMLSHAQRVMEKEL